MMDFLKIKNKMRKLASIICFSLLLNVNAQKYITKSGLTEFKASVEAFEPVEAKNKSTTAILDTSNGEIAALLFIKAFEFRVALMQEHFNENYMESDKFSKATFKGNLEKFDASNLNATYQIKGELSIRGQTKNISTLATLKKDGEIINLEAEFDVSPSDFDIKIPSIVEEKISKTIVISLKYELIEKK